MARRRQTKASLGAGDRGVEFSENLDLKQQKLGVRAQIRRAQRSIDRFTHFENEPMSGDALEALEDDFLDAIEAIRHLRDWAKKTLAEEGREADLSEVLNLPRQAVARAIGDASKHRGVDNNRGHFPDSIRLQSVASTQFSESLADFYRRLRLVWGTTEEHPADFLAASLTDWESFLARHAPAAGAKPKSARAGNSAASSVTKLSSTG